MTSPSESLHDRIAQVINTRAFRRTLADGDVDLIEFQLEWNESGGEFDKLPRLYQDAIRAGERETAGAGELVFA